MKKKCLTKFTSHFVLIGLLTIFVLTSYGQNFNNGTWLHTGGGNPYGQNFNNGSWQYTKGGNPFDGFIKKAYVVSNSYELSVVYNAKYDNLTIELYGISVPKKQLLFFNGKEIGDPWLTIEIGFDNYEDVYDAKAKIHSFIYNDSKPLYITNIYDKDRKTISKYYLIKKIKSKSKLYLRVYRDDKTIDIVFPLRGSTKAINQVISNDLLNERLKEAQRSINSDPDFYIDW